MKHSNLFLPLPGEGVGPASAKNKNLSVTEDFGGSMLIGYYSPL